ncbi:UAA transporter [Entophlyctis helioformis]|nr:UAA transporter [Entophlyctis helioformis]
MLELAACVLGIYACFLTWGITQERVSTTPYDGKRFRYFVFLNVCQALIASCVGLAYLRLRRQKLGWLSRPLFTSYLQLAFFGSIASPFGYAALRHIDYPTLILGKSCKLIPVMLMNFLIYRRTFPLQKYLVVLLITIGVASFMLQQPRDPHKPAKGPTSSSLLGLALLSINLLIDGATNSTQDRIFSRFKVTGTSMMVYMNLISFAMMTVYLFVGPYFNGIFASVAGLWDAVAFCTRHPTVIYDILLFGFAGALGQCFIFHTLEHFGALVLVTVTVTRKMFSILLSVFAFNHHVSPGQWGSVAVVFLGIAWESFGKSGKKKADPSKGNVAGPGNAPSASGPHGEEEVDVSTPVLKSHATPTAIRSRTSKSK